MLYAGVSCPQGERWRLECRIFRPDDVTALILFLCVGKSLNRPKRRLAGLGLEALWQVLAVPRLVRLAKVLASGVGLAAYKYPEYF